MSPLSKASLVLALLLLLAGGGARAAEQADHHAFLSGRSSVPPEAPLVVPINHTIFAYATIWYSARVEAGPPVEAFFLDEPNRARFLAGEPFRVLEGTHACADTETGGSAVLPQGLYYLVVAVQGAEVAQVKWEVFFEPRASAQAEELASLEDPVCAAGAGPLPLLAGVAAAVGVGLAVVFLWRRRSGTA